MANVLLFKIENTWGTHLYHILPPLEKYDNGYWIVSDIQIWCKKANDFIELFSDKRMISNEDFFSTIRGEDYYIVGGCFQFMKNDIYKHDTDAMLTVKIYDSIYVEMWTNDDTVFDELYKNAVKEQFLDIEIGR